MHPFIFLSTDLVVSCKKYILLCAYTFAQTMVTKRFLHLGQERNRTHTITNAFVLIQMEALSGAGRIVTVVTQGNTSVLKVS